MAMMARTTSNSGLIVKLLWPRLRIEAGDLLSLMADAQCRVLKSYRDHRSPTWI